MNSTIVIPTALTRPAPRPTPLLEADVAILVTLGHALATALAATALAATALTPDDSLTAAKATTLIDRIAARNGLKAT